MKKDIHPEYHEDAIIKCACGNTIKTGSSKKEAEIEICSACHPFFTGKKKVIDTAGRVEKFQSRLESARQARLESARQARVKKASKK